MRKNTFTKIAGSTYKCDCCGRGTRNTGVQSFSSMTCPQCFELAGLENEVSDGYQTTEEVRLQVEDLVAQVEAKGGNAGEWRQTFGLEARS